MFKKLICISMLTVEYTVHWCYHFINHIKVDKPVQGLTISSFLYTWYLSSENLGYEAHVLGGGGGGGE